MRKMLLMLSLALAATNLEAQDFMISFAGIGAITTIDNVKVENLTQGKSININGSDILHLMGIVTGINQNLQKGEGHLKVYPNPIGERGLIEFNSSDFGRTKIEIYDITGRKIASEQAILSKGKHYYYLTGLGRGIYTLKFITQGNSYNIKLLGNNLLSSNVKIECEGFMDDNENLKSGQTEVVMQYNQGDFLKFTGNSDIYSIVLSDVPSQSMTIEFPFVKCTDADGNNYSGVKINSQLWMGENLKTKRYNNGDLIGTTNPYNLDIYNETEPKYQWAYNGVETNADTYGRYYTWFTVKDNRGICPAGWHIPTDAEWTAMEDYLISSGFNYDGTTIENKLCKSLSATTSWNFTTNEGVAGNTDFSEYRNRTGFNALAAGFRLYDGNFYGMGISGRWWSASKNDNDFSWGRNIDYEKIYVYRYDYYQEHGNSVRCIKD